jgi:alkylation response protein AidB-like acyl-CoA dehydrogenase
MNFDLDDAHRAFALRFESACRGIAARARETDERATIPAQNWRELANAGYLGLFHPRRFGGTEADGLSLALAMDQLARACASTFWSASISTLLCGRMLADLCSPAHCDRWLRAIVSGTAIGCFAATENGAGSDPSSYRTTLHRGPNGYRLRGEKSRISNAGVADVAIVLARLDEPTGPKLCYVVVDLQSPGVHRSELDKLGLRGMSWGNLSFDDVAIAPQDVIVDASVELTLRSVEWGQLLQAWCALGLAEAALEACREHAAGRHAFGRPIAHLPVVYERIAALRAELDGSCLMALEATWRKGSNRPARELVMMAKIHATELAVRIADAAMRTLGGWGYTKQHAVERLLRDSYANVPAGLPTDRLRELLVCPLLGIDPWVYEAFDMQLTSP